MSSIRSIKSLVPLLDRVLVQRLKPEVRTASGLFLPEAAAAREASGNGVARVLAVGPGALDRDGNRVAVSVKAGDRVVVPQFGGSPIKIGEDEYSLFRDHELLAKVAEE